MNLLREIRDRFRPLLQELVDDPRPLLEMIRPAQDARFGEYQANLAMSLAKQLRQSPRQLAEQLAARLAVDDLCHAPEVAGPGFINLRLKEDWLSRQLQTLEADPRLGVALADPPRTLIVDYSSPNVAKAMHVGHIRSTVIGDALVRILRFLGHRVVADNHLGDWGTQFGMIIYGYRHFADPRRYQAAPLKELGRIYQQVRRLIDYHQALRELPELKQQLQRQQGELAEQQSRGGGTGSTHKKHEKQLRRLQAQVAETIERIGAAEESIRSVQQNPLLRELSERHAGIQQAVLDETAKLHAGDPENLQLWREFLPKSRQEIQRIYDRLDIHFDVELGESFYQERLADVVGTLTERGLARESEGAICVFVEGFESPMVIRKRDGAFLYATTDLATISYRMERWNPDVILYVVDHRQSEHFAKLFAVARLWGFETVELRHISFGTVLGEDERPFRTRAGDTVGLEGLLDEAVRRALRVVSDNDDAKPGGAELSPQQRQQVANVIGHAAIKYADLSQNRTSDYVFSYDKMVAMQGNTATYMQYCYARIRNIFAKGHIDPASVAGTGQPIQLGHPSERALAVKLVQLEETLADVVVDYRPNILTAYLYELAKAFSEFYESCPVLQAEDVQVRASRLRLSWLVARTISQALQLLGIRVVDKM